MKPYEAQPFQIPELKGISSRNIEEHLKLYQGYVKNANLIGEKLGEMYQDGMDKHQYEASEIVRRFSFEYNGMRNHELYFESFVGGAHALSADSPLRKKIEATQGSFDIWFSIFTTLAMTRGIGWAVLWYDKTDDRLLNTWVDEQHLGQLQGCTPILAIDMWEHAFVADYQPSGKKQYIEDFFANLNWQVIEERFAQATKNA